MYQNAYVRIYTQNSGLWYRIFGWRWRRACWKSSYLQYVVREIEIRKDGDAKCLQILWSILCCRQVFSFNQPVNLHRKKKSRPNVIRKCFFRSRGECFGLVGNNGAGKSSIFKMLMGETIISSGEIFTRGLNHKFQLKQIYKMIGYCPQIDAFLSGLTCRETLEIFAMIRGIPSQNVKSYIQSLSESLDFMQHIDKKFKQLRWAYFLFKNILTISWVGGGALRIFFLYQSSEWNVSNIDYIGLSKFTFER